MKLVVLGTGYVGLVSGACFAELGHKVKCVDIDLTKVDKINKGESPIHEEGLEHLIKKNIVSGNLEASSNLRQSIKGADITMIAVGTPFDGSEIDLSYIHKAIEDICNVIEDAPKHHIICIKSTVVPGTSQNIFENIIPNFTSREIGLAMNPEFLAEGSAVKDFMNPDRIVIGSNNESTTKMMQNLYSHFEEVEIINTSLSTAEMIKYASNSFLASVISYSNEIANLCSSIKNIDVVDVMNGVSKDRRLSPIVDGERITPGLMSFLYPGTGFGGSCFPKDIKALSSFSNKKNYEMSILDAVIKVNNNQPLVTMNLLKDSLGSLKDKKITVLGLAFKPETDDIRESPAITILNELINSGANILAHDPIASKNMSELFMNKNIKFFDNLEEVCRNETDAFILVTSWQEYKNLHNFINPKSSLIIDGRRFLDKNIYSNYKGIGL